MPVPIERKLKDKKHAENEKIRKITRRKPVLASFWLLVMLYTLTKSFQTKDVVTVRWLDLNTEWDTQNGNAFCVLFLFWLEDGSSDGIHV